VVDKFSLPLYRVDSDSCWGLVDVKSVLKDGEEVELETFPQHKLEVAMEIRDDQNYELIVFSLVEGEQQIAKHSLSDCSVSPVDSQIFELFHVNQQSRDRPLIVWAGENHVMLQWKETLNAIIEVAKKREEVLKRNN
jgi:hypothetical protein